MNIMKCGFLIATYLEKECHKLALAKCISSIRQFHTEQIVVIVNSSSLLELLNEIMYTYTDNILYELNTETGIPADMQLYKMWYSKKYFDIAVTLQDSMYLRNKIHFENDSDVEFLWHFTNHRIQWSTIQEPHTEFNSSNQIRTHDDLILYCLKQYVKNDIFRKYALEMYPKKYNWCGCFGFMTKMSYAFLCKLEEKTNLLDVMQLTTTNRLRRVMESIFALACQFTIGSEIHSSLDGLYYDGINYHNGFKGHYIGKQSYDRE